MAIVYRTSDRLKVKVGELVVVISPLNRFQKSRIQTLISQGSMYESAAEAFKCAIKDIEGMELPNGDKYKLEFDDNKELKDECLDDILNLDAAGNLMLISTALLDGIPKEFVNPATGKKLEGVSYIKSEESTEKK